MRLQSRIPILQCPLLITYDVKFIKLRYHLSVLNYHVIGLSLKGLPSYKHFIIWHMLIISPLTLYKFCWPLNLYPRQLKVLAQQLIHKLIVDLKYLKDAPLNKETQNILKSYAKNLTLVFTKDSGHVDHSNLVTIDTRNQSTIASKPYTFWLKHIQWIKEELECLEKVNIITRHVLPS